MIILFFTFPLFDQTKNLSFLNPSTSGSTKLLDSIDSSIIEFSKNPFIINQPLSIELSKKIVHKKIILLITDGLDNNSRTTKEYIKEKLQNQKINLVIIGYTYNQEVIQNLRDLAYSTLEGLYVDINASENLDYVFLNMVENGTGPILQVETFT